MEQKLKQLRNLLGEIEDINQATAVLGWDLQTYLPAGGTEARGHQMGTLMSIAHSKGTSDEMGRLLEDLKPYAGQLAEDSDEARLIKVTLRDYNKKVRVPPEWVEEFARVTTSALDAWQRARSSSTFSVFQPHLEKILELRRQYAGMFAPYQHIYDPLLDDYEPGMKTAEVQAIFNTLRPVQVDLLKAIRQHPQVDDAFLHLAYPEQGQWDFGVDVITRFGFDWKRGRQDRSAHPFTTSFGSDDVRITTRFDPLSLSSAMLSTFHECGHALYEQGIDPNLSRTPLAMGASMAIHESQSRLWENLVGRSLPFWSFFFPRLKERFPQQLENVDLMAFYRAINRVEQSYIRTEADEATYNLHVMLRMEIEIDLLEGKLAVRDLPDKWNTLMEEYLGINPPNDAQGVLQDVHWSNGSIGYFPTYAIGNLISVQLWEKINQDLPNLELEIAQGEFGSLLNWLRTHVHCYGAKFEPQELIQKATGSKIDPQPYLRYLQSKYAQIYQL